MPQRESQSSPLLYRFRVPTVDQEEETYSLTDTKKRKRTRIEPGQVKEVHSVLKLFIPHLSDATSPTPSTSEHAPCGNEDADPTGTTRGSVPTQRGQPPAISRNEESSARRTLRTKLMKHNAASLKFVLRDVWPSYRSTEGGETTKAGAVDALIQWVSVPFLICSLITSLCLCFSEKHNRTDRKQILSAAAVC